MQREVLQVNFEGRTLDFTYPAGGNIVAHLREIFSGKTYPLPRLPAGYRHELVVDIGANVGASALWFQAAARPRRIVCFEPAAANHACLAANLAPFPHAETNPWGLFSRDREAPLYHGQSQCMQHSLVPSIEVGSRAETILLKRASAEFDRLGLDRISILKIDTEGCEVPILEDLAGRLHRVDQIYVEYHSEEDRRAIDALLAPRFSLAFSSAFFVHRGVVLYLANELAEAVESLAALRLARPAA